MNNNAYLFFHLNLAFSSVEESERHDVINSCYSPLLDLIESNDIPIGIEISAWTLNQINKINPNWIQRFKKHLETNQCELIGSGYCQIISPLVPYSVNDYNIKLGFKYYDEILGIKPELMLVNEMAYSRSIVDLYLKHNVVGFIMEKNNILLGENDIINISNESSNYAKGNNNRELPVLWSDSILFQKVQHYCHGDISLDDYINFIKNTKQNHGELTCVYSNDAEVFDFRPGRFDEESKTHPEGEWNRLNLLLNTLKDKLSLNFILPRDALKISQNKKKTPSLFTTAAYPIPVKKQSKYNIARWSVTGVDDIWINTLCHRIEKYLRENYPNNINEWKNLCELWSSDLRTHITKVRWNKAKNKLVSMLKRYNLSIDYKTYNLEGFKYKKISKNSFKNNIGFTFKNDEILFSIRTKNTELFLNKRRGLTIEKLSFKSHNFKPCIGRLNHGHFKNILLGADFYSGGIIIETPISRQKVTDLISVDPCIAFSDSAIHIKCSIPSKIGTIYKFLELNIKEESLSICYNFNGLQVLGSVRVGIITFLNDFQNSTQMHVCNGSNDYETFNFDGEIDHCKSASTFVSSSRGLGATTGNIKIINNENILNFRWNPEDCAVLPMLLNRNNNKQMLKRLFFSLQEYDDTKKTPSVVPNFKFNISSF